MFFKVCARGIHSRLIRHILTRIQTKTTPVNDPKPLLAHVPLKLTGISLVAVHVPWYHPWARPLHIRQGMFPMLGGRYQVFPWSTKTTPVNDLKPLLAHVPLKLTGISTGCRSSFSSTNSFHFFITVALSRICVRRADRCTCHKIINHNVSLVKFKLMINCKIIMIIIITE